MAKHSRSERAKRVAQNEAVARIEAAWSGSISPADAKAFAQRVAEARARVPEPQPDMAPGTAPRPPRPGREPKPPKDNNRPKRRY